MKVTLIKALLLLSASLPLGLNAQFLNRDRMDKMESFDFQQFSWGFYLNGNSFDYHTVLHPRYGMDGNRSLVSTKSSLSFGAGLIGKMRLNETFDLRVEPGLQFSQREIHFDTQTNDIYAPGTTQNLPFTPIALKDQDKVRKVKGTYVDIPVMVEMHGNRWYNSRPYLAAGFNYIVNTQSNAKSTDDNSQAVFRTTTHNFAYSAEMGIQFYFSRFKLTPGVRGTFFMNNEKVADNPTTPPYWEGAISTLQTRAIMFVLKFE